jgi:formylglycine-generating enzyme required for sulfatase activity/DNA-binding SARP family transcriptional activator
MSYRLQLLGNFQLIGPGGPIEVDSRKVRALLAYLACAAKPPTRSVLATLLWGSHFDTQARQNLRQALTKIRRLLGEDVLVTEGETVGIRAGAITTDVAELQRLSQLDTPEARVTAAELHGGRFAQDISVAEKAWSEWAEALEKRCEKLLADAMLSLAEHEAAQGCPEPSLEWARRAVAVDAFREDGHRAIIRALMALGRRIEAAQHYQELAEFLRRELDVEPEAATRSLAEELKTCQPAGRSSRPAAFTAAMEPLGQVAPLPPLVEPRQPQRSTEAAVAESNALPGAGLRPASAYPHVLAAFAAVLLAWVAAIYVLPSQRTADARPETSSAARAPDATRILKHCDTCPEMVALPPGEFVMGSPPTEVGRYEVEGPQRRIVFAKGFAIGRYHVTIGEFEAFAKETGYQAPEQCKLFDAEQNRFVDAPGSFRSPGFKVLNSKPAVCVTWSEAKQYTQWLAQKTGQPYRLPSEAEFEYAARAGTTTLYSWGDDASLACEFARFADLASPIVYASTCYSKIIDSGPAPVGSLKPNRWGLYDIPGNAWSVVEDCWTTHFRYHPADGSPLTVQENCVKGVFRGGAWHSRASYMRPAGRVGLGPNWRANTHGFRVALTLDGQ